LSELFELVSADEKDWLEEAEECSWENEVDQFVSADWLAEFADGTNHALKANVSNWLSASAGFQSFVCLRGSLFRGTLVE